MRPQRQKSYHRNKNKHWKKRRHDGPPPFDVMLRQFKKKCERAGIVAEDGTMCTDQISVS